MGRMNKDLADNLIVYFPCLAVATFTMWVCAWLHQWHPLVVPEYEKGEH